MNDETNAPQEPTPAAETPEELAKRVQDRIEGIDEHIEELRGEREQINRRIKELRQERAEFARLLPRKPREKKA